MNITLSDKYVLKSTPVSNSTIAEAVETPTHHIALIDCSGSMSWDLPKVREHLKRKLPKLLRDIDTISIIWFSGRGDFGILLEAEPVATLKDLKDVETAIDRWLRPIGLTGFKEPIEEVAKLINRVSKKNGVFSLFFMSDGCDNSWARSEILKAIDNVSGLISGATVVEYGYYADRQLLTQMAEKFGGTHIFAQNFVQYEPSFDAAMQRKVSGAPKVSIKVGEVVNDFAFAIVDKDLLTFTVENGAVSVPENVGKIWYVAQGGSGSKQTDLQALYAALALFAKRVNGDIVWAILKVLGDVRLIDLFANCFGKQKYSDFVDAATAATFDESKRLIKGYDPNKVPNDDAFTVFDLLHVLAANPENRILLDSKDFGYSKIGRSVVDSNEVLTADEQAEIAALTQQMAGLKDVKALRGIQEKIASITANKPKALVFTKTEEPKGVPVSNLTFNEERPNISILVRRAGTVDLTDRLPEGSKVPAKFPTYIWRNYAIVKDGIINVTGLPLRLTGGTIRDLLANGMPLEAIRNTSGETLEEAITRVKKASQEREVPVLIDLTTLPVINRQMVKAVSAKSLFEMEYELCRAQAAQKVYKDYKKTLFPKKSEGFIETYGEESAKWLQEQGLTDFNGFNPKVVQAEAQDFYLSKTMKVSLKGFSSLPSLKDVREKMAKGKLTPSASLVAGYIKEVDAYLDTDEYKNSSDRDKLFEAWVGAKTELAIDKVRSILHAKSQILFSIIVGQMWFEEFTSLEDKSLTIKVDGQDIVGTVELKEVETKI